MFEALLTAEGLIALLTLTFLEIVLGIDNIIFISILTNKLPLAIRAKARTVGIGLALVFRIIMLLGITWIIGFTKPLFEIFGHAVTGRDAILFIGGLFLLAKSTKEIHHKISDAPPQIPGAGGKAATGFMAAIIQIALLDIVFSFDSILTAIGMTNNLPIMIIAVIISLIIMLVFSGKISAFIEQHVSLQILALSFLILIGVLLIAESAGSHVPKGYIYFAVAFSLIVELVNMRADKKRKAQELTENKN